MYVTRPLSMYKRNPSALSSAPPEGSNSGILIIQDEEVDLTCCFCCSKIDFVKDLPFPQNKNLTASYTSALSSAPPEGSNSGILIIQDEEVDLTCCFCCSKIDFVKDLPFPQNKNLTVSYTTSTADGQTINSTNQVIFIPVLNQPLSSNRYYVIERQGKHKGEANTNAKEEDETTCCFGFCRHNPDKEPQSFDPKDVYEQFEICKSKRFGYVSKSVAPDGIPPYFLRRKGWTLDSVNLNCT
uniref:Uncharacterized protein n=1 Tax=Populus alba TaxID=43335 RepID=A0A4U5Q459_POPAL|nr:hypothetical protein D5086_0000138400 [Populus alba]